MAKVRDASPQTASKEEATTGAIALPVTFRLPGMAYFTVGFTLLGALLIAGASVEHFGWILALPVIQAIWMRRLRTTVTETGLTVVDTFRKRDITWEQIEGLQFPRWGAVRAVLADKSRVRLPAIAFRDLPKLSVASGGRIPDPYQAPPASDSAETADDEPGTATADDSTGDS